MSDSKQIEPQVNGGLILALSILGLLLCGPLTIVSWLMANGALRTLWNYPHSGQRGLAQAGQVISIIGMILWVLIIGAKVIALNERGQRANRSYGANITIDGRPANPNSLRDRILIDSVSGGRGR
ncbi:hypothetical protein [Armatimonas rosea]|uniref:DUF4190 domain-containing protein n=1 Tax=Armatimonas rosea TaxID=685828 RepID=A0A7W9SRR3_ARMRO|nr:hypothetical protein [Armatimonas rosea]MBB6050979.1 hypothetical protein [Armatimonas rosea]